MTGIGSSVHERLTALNDAFGTSVVGQKVFPIADGVSTIQSQESLGERFLFLVESYA